MMVCEIEENMPPDEVVFWVAYFEIKSAKMKKEADKMKNQNNSGNVRSKRYR